MNMDTAGEARGFPGGAQYFCETFNSGAAEVYMPY